MSEFRKIEYHVQRQIKRDLRLSADTLGSIASYLEQWGTEQDKEFAKKLHALAYGENSINNWQIEKHLVDEAIAKRKAEESK